MRRPSSRVPAGICERTPAAYSAADGPASRRSTEARPTLTVAGMVRSVTNSFPCRVNQVCKTVCRDVPPGGVADETGVDVDVGVWLPLGGCAVLAGWP